MKRLTALFAVCALALPLFAADKTTDEAKKDEKKTTTATNEKMISAPAEETKPAERVKKVKSLDGGGASGDSPLVAASKRTNRLGKAPSSTVITNADVEKNKDKGHLTTTTNQREIPKPVSPADEKKSDEQLAREALEKKLKAEKDAEEKVRKEKADKEKSQGLIQSLMEGDHPAADEIDPAQLEQAAEQAAKAKKGGETSETEEKKEKPKDENPEANLPTQPAPQPPVR